MDVIHGHSLAGNYFRDPVISSENFYSMRNASVIWTDGGDPVDEILEGKWRKLEGSYKVIESGHRPMTKVRRACGRHDQLVQ